MAGRKRRGTSVGTIVMLAVTAAVLGGSVLVLGLLSGGHSADLSRLTMQVVSLRDEARGQETDPPAETARAEARASAAPRAANPPEKKETAEERRTVLTFGGTIAVENNTRRSGYAADTGKYDFTDFFSLLRPEIQGREAGAFLENVLLEGAKVSTAVIPGAGAEMMSAAGFTLSFSGFGRAWEKGAEGIRSTIVSLKGAEVDTLGLLMDSSADRYMILDSDGVRVALMQYTDQVSANTRKSMQKNNADGMIPAADAEAIAADIAAARSSGADAVIVLLNWGKTGAKNPDKAQILLAQRIADSGADAVIGAGSRIPQRVEKLIAADGREVLCAYSLGTLLSDSRKVPARTGGFLLHLTLRLDSGRRLTVEKAEYTPTYIWKYRQDSKDYYRVLASDRSAPDGMDSEQVRQMQKTLAAVQETLQGSAVTIR